MTDLRPCPFCGEPPTVDVDALDDNIITCDTDGCIMWPHYYTHDDWQHRPIEDALAADNARLRALIYEALALIGQGHEPGEYAESVWIAGVVNTLKEVDNGS